MIPLAALRPPASMATTRSAVLSTSSAIASAISDRMVMHGSCSFDRDMAGGAAPPTGLMASADFCRSQMQAIFLCKARLLYLSPAKWLSYSQISLTPFEPRLPLVPSSTRGGYRYAHVFACPI